MLFAFGKANEDKNEYQTAFAAYTKGNQVKSSVFHGIQKDSTDNVMN
ncbi:MAG: hypothetical protein CM15mP126_3970 [Gammaproteobacteria bacterium]|nr:MAG: hypothetical protein CM15mP126_3970 [Gammaproteobacteria bacterium]